MKLKFTDKYVFLYDESGNQIQYWEHFVSIDSKRVLICVACENLAGRKFIKQNHLAVMQNVTVYWFGRKIKSMPIFVHTKDHTDAIILT